MKENKVEITIGVQNRGKNAIANAGNTINPCFATFGLYKSVFVHVQCGKTVTVAQLAHLLC